MTLRLQFVYIQVKLRLNSGDTWVTLGLHLGYITVGCRSGHTAHRIFEGEELATLRPHLGYALTAFSRVRSRYT